jgi:hypothetical protein
MVKDKVYEPDRVKRRRERALSNHAKYGVRMHLLDMNCKYSMSTMVSHALQDATEGVFQMDSELSGFLSEHTLAHEPLWVRKEVFARVAKAYAVLMGGEASRVGKKNDLGYHVVGLEPFRTLMSIAVSTLG